MKLYISLCEIIFIFFLASCAGKEISNNLILQVRDISSSENEKMKDFNLYLTNWNSFKDIPVYDQSGIPACYAFASSQLAEYYVRKTGQLSESRENISPLWSAYLFKEKSGNITSPIKWLHKTIGEGVGRPTLKQIRKFGSCKSSVIIQNVKSILPNSKLSEIDIVAMIELIWSYRDEKNIEDVVELLKDNYDFKNLNANYLVSLGQDIEGKKLADLDRSQIVEDLKIVKEYILQQISVLGTKNYFHFFEKSILKNCDQAANILNFSLPKVAAKGQLFSTNNRIIGLLDRAFENVNYEQPVSVGYCSNVYKPEIDGRSVKKRHWFIPRIVDRSLMKGKKCSAHYSLLVGRRYNASQNSYDYLIRNSRGRFYMPLTNGCFCHNKLTNQFENCHMMNEEKVIAPEHMTVLGCWVNQDKLAKTIYDINYFKIKPEVKEEPEEQEEDYNDSLLQDQEQEN